MLRRALVLCGGLFTAGMLMSCEDHRSVATGPDGLPSGFAPPDACEPWPECRDGGGGGGGDEDGGGGVLFDLLDEDADNGLQIGDANHGDLFNDGGRWLDIGFDGTDGLPAVTINYDGTKAAYDAGRCSASNTTSAVTAADLAGYLVSDPGTVFSGGATVDKKGDEGSSSADHRVAVQFDDPGNGHRILVALTGSLGFGEVSMAGDASADPATLTFADGTVRVRDRSVGSSSSQNPILDCPHEDFVKLYVDRQ